jgi:nicotinate phosphoribosyltransferase
MVYKLVARSDDGSVMRPVEKRSASKTSIGGRKWAMRRLDPDGVAEAEVVGIEERPTDDGDDRPLMVDLVRDGEVVAVPDLAAARERHRLSRSELPPSALRLQRGDVELPTVFEDRARP